MIACYSVMNMLMQKNALSVMRLDGNLLLPVLEITVPEEITSWCRNDDEGSNIDVSVIENIKPVEFEDVQFVSDDDTDDDEAYVNDGHVAPLGQEELDDDQGFFA